MDDAIALVGEASVLVLGTPIYRAAYSGQLKAFFDLLPQQALTGKVAGLIATGRRGQPRAGDRPCAAAADRQPGRTVRGAVDLRHR